MMKFKPYFTDKHREFIEEVRLKDIQGVSNDFSDVYTEKFTCGPLAQVQAALDPNTNWHNRIEGETITRPDVGSLRKEVWTNYLQVAGTEADVADKDFDIASNIINVRLYAKVVQNFIKDELALKEGGVNLPLPMNWVSYPSTRQATRSRIATVACLAYLPRSCTASTGSPQPW